MRLPPIQTSDPLAPDALIRGFTVMDSITVRLKWLEFPYTEVKIMFNFRYGAALVALLAVISAGFAYQASHHLGNAGKAAAEARVATFHTYRIAQKIYSLIHGYELSINEYYSTALKQSDYLKKSDEFKTSIEAELAALDALKTSDATTVGELKAALKEIEMMRTELENALASENKNWDLAREALYKLTIVSVRASQPSELLAKVAGEQATALDKTWGEYQAQALMNMRIAMALALAACGLAVTGFFRISGKH